MGCASHVRLVGHQRSEANDTGVVVAGDAGGVVGRLLVYITEAAAAEEPCGQQAEQRSALFRTVISFL